MNKVLLIICDGLGDRPVFELGSKTPLEAAKKPNIDKLAKRAVTGLMHTVDIGVRPGSDVAHLSLFGYDLSKYYTGRGPFEAAGYGIDLKIGDVAFRGNFATVDSNFIVRDRRAGRIEDTKPLIDALSGLTIDDIRVYIKQGIGHRIAVVLRGRDIDNNISNIDPHKTGVKIDRCEAFDNSVFSKKSAKIVNLFTKKAYEILSNHPLNKKREKEGKLPANIILLRGAGVLTKVPSFEKKYQLKAACIAGAGLYKGIAKILGMEILSVVGATGKPDTNIKSKIKKALQCFRYYDFIFVHIKGTDVLSEDGDYIGKKSFIERIDEAFELLADRDDILITLTADHSTSSYLKIHTADPVPLLIAGKNIYTDSVATFGERSVSSGKLGHIRGKHLMPIIIDFLGKAPLLGA